MTLPTSPPTVHVIDDDQGMRKSVLRLLKAAGMVAKGFSSAEEFLEAWSPNDRGCLLVDLWMPGMTGLELQAELFRRRAEVPIILLSARPQVPDVVRAVKVGAIDFLQKPVSHEVLLDRVQRALDEDARRRRQAERRHEIESRFSLLTHRERQVMHHLAEGMNPKRIARELGISSKTADVHRARLLQKLQVDGVVGLLRLVHERDKLVAVRQSPGQS